ncbi:MAG: PP2C family protein-serine/threonine phosphatase [Longimicrobiales bacterium]
MSTLPPNTAPTLPRAAAALLQSFGADSGSAVRLWAPTGTRWVLVYPPDSAARETAPRADTLRRAVENGTSPLELEIAGGRAGAAEAGLLADALGRLLAYEREAQQAARELAERYEEINLLYSISEILGAVRSLESAASRILEEVAELLGARRASLWVFHSEDRQLHLTAAVGEEGMTGPVYVDDPNSITARVFRERQALNLERGDHIPRGIQLEPRPRDREAFLSVPIQFSPPEGEPRTVGVITLLGRTHNVRFNAGDVRLLSAIASQIGAALETHRLMEESVRQERLVREMELAHHLQMKLLPDVEQFQGPGEVAARCAPAESVGGDFFHLFRLSGDRLGVMIGDVSSHGFSAALIMALTMSAVAIYAQEAEPPSVVLRRVHEALIDELESTEMYMTLFYGVLDPGRSRLRYANAGHPHAFRVPAGASAERLGATSAPLGVVPLPDYKDAEIEWQVGGDLLLLFTDGLSEAYSHRGATGEAALVEAVQRVQQRTPPEILQRIFERAAEGDTQTTPADDRTAVLVRI